MVCCISSLVLLQHPKKGFLVKCIGMECKQQVSPKTQFSPLPLSLSSGDTKRRGLASIFALLITWCGFVRIKPLQKNTSKNALKFDLKENIIGFALEPSYNFIACYLPLSTTLIYNTLVGGCEPYLRCLDVIVASL